ncbi:unnamed protein product [Linum trigynum]|uniref:Uncharacterized protein n=1 Tax=Linum trigynum TaxID=586398 RepID=A0AAV2EDT9_9ROSI
MGARTRGGGTAKEETGLGVGCGEEELAAADDGAEGCVSDLHRAFGRKGDDSDLISIVAWEELRRGVEELPTTADDEEMGARTWGGGTAKEETGLGVGCGEEELAAADDGAEGCVSDLHIAFDRKGDDSDLISIVAWEELRRGVEELPMAADDKEMGAPTWGGGTAEEETAPGVGCGEEELAAAVRWRGEGGAEEDGVFDIAGEGFSFWWLKAAKGFQPL